MILIGVKITKFMNRECYRRVAVALEVVVVMWWGVDWNIERILNSFRYSRLEAFPLWANVNNETIFRMLQWIVDALWTLSKAMAMKKYTRTRDLSTGWNFECVLALVIPTIFVVVFFLPIFHNIKLNQMTFWFDATIL